MVVIFPPLFLNGVDIQSNSRKTPGPIVKNVPKTVNFLLESGTILFNHSVGWRFPNLARSDLNFVAASNEY
jgi:hypothetical protein